jgi:hypothetical protein
VHHVGFIVLIYYDERSIKREVYAETYPVLNSWSDVASSTSSPCSSSSAAKQNAHHINSLQNYVTDSHNIHTIDLQERIKNANKIYFMLQKLFTIKNISKKLKLKLKNIIDKTLTL